MPDDKTYEEEDGYKKVDRRVIKDDDDAAPEEPTPVEEEPSEPAFEPEPEEPAPDEEQPSEPAFEPEPEEPAPDEEQLYEPAFEPEPEEPAPDEEQLYEPAFEPEEPAPDEEPAQDEPTNWAEVGVYGVLRFAVSLLVQLAWINLGIQAPPGGDTRENLPEAQAAISSLGDIITRLEPDLSPDEKRELDAMLANLRINYIQRAG